MRSVNADHWWEAYRFALGDGFEDYLIAEDQAKSIASYHLTSVCGLFQTEGYARATTRAVVPYSASQEIIDTWVEIRLRRQWHILEREKPPQIHAVLDEHILHRVAGGQQVFLEQLRHLSKLAALDHITLQIIPFSAGIYWPMIDKTELTLMSVSLDRRFDFMSYEEMDAQHNSKDRNHIFNHWLQFERLTHLAATPEESQALLEDAIASIYSKSTSLRWKASRHE